VAEPFAEPGIPTALPVPWLGIRQVPIEALCERTVEVHAFLDSDAPMLVGWCPAWWRHDRPARFALRCGLGWWRTVEQPFVEARSPAFGELGVGFGVMPAEGAILLG